MIGPTDEEMRVLGCLIEKQRTVPDQYPLTLNSLRLACNQSTNRDPVVDFDEATVRRALGELGRRRWIRGASGHTSRSAKYRQLFEDEMGLDQDQVSILAVLMLRGPQTPGELKQRVDRLFSFHDLAAVHTTLDALIGRELVERMPRRPGQKEERYRQMIGGSHLGDDAGDPLTPGSDAATGPAENETSGAPASGAAPAPTAAPVPVPVDTPETERIEALERGSRESRAEIDRLTDEIAALRSELNGLKEQLGA
ncbi:MAG: YceH family protein [Actinomycetota bacterium]|nr:YceH family protein [Actinomycetota bacterium]